MSGVLRAAEAGEDLPADRVVPVAEGGAHGNRVATSLSPSAACEAVRAGACDAATKCASLKLRPVQTPASIAVEATSVSIADLFAMLPIVKRVDALTVQFASPTMRHAIRVLNSLSAMSSVLR